MTGGCAVVVLEIVGLWVKVGRMSRAKSAKSQRKRGMVIGIRSNSRSNPRGDKLEVQYPCGYMDVLEHREQALSR